MTAWNEIRHALVFREVSAALWRIPPEHVLRPWIAGWATLLTLHTPDHRGRCTECRGPWYRATRADCVIVTTLHTALHPDPPHHADRDRPSRG